jgi:hypothetical protein
MVETIQNFGIIAAMIIAGVCISARYLINIQQTLLEVIKANTAALTHLSTIVDKCKQNQGEKHV